MHGPHPQNTNGLFAALIVGLCALLTACQQTPPAATVAVNPAHAELAPTETLDFTATTTGTSNTDVTWTTTCGDVDGDGTTITYTAPSDDGTCELTATSVADASASATATITIVQTEPVDVLVTIAPATAQLAQGQAQTFTASVSGTDDTDVTWTTTCGDIDGDGDGDGTSITYTAPSDDGTCELSVISDADPTKTATATITIDAIGISIEPSSLEAFFGQTRTITATVAGGIDTSVTWGISPTCGTILGTGATVDYTAPTSLPIGRCAITATSDADPTKQASLTVAVYPPPKVAFTATPATVAPGEAVSFSWTLTNQSRTLPLTCELFVLGNGITPTYTIDDCGRRASQGTQSHAYSGSGDYLATLTVRQGDTALSSASTAVLVAIDAVHISAGSSHSLVLDSRGYLWTWGHNATGQLGDGTTTNRSDPAPVCASGSGATCERFNIGTAGRIVGGGASFAIDSTGLVWAWGNNAHGRVGDGTTTNRSNPVPVCASGSGATCQPFSIGSTGRISMRGGHVVAVDGNGDVWSWGYNSSGQVGDGTSGNDNATRSNPTPVCRSGTGSGCVQFNIGTSRRVAAGSSHTLAVDHDGLVWAWGSGSNGELGTGTTLRQSNPTPVCITGSADTCVPFELGSGGDVSAGGAFSLAIGNDGSVWSWGRGEHGRLGDGTNTTRTRPVKVCASGALSTCVQLDLGPGARIAAGAAHALAIDGSGQVWAWGRGEFGRLGDGATSNRSRPVTVCASGTGATCVPFNVGATGGVGGGNVHSLAIDSAGSVWAWGYNLDGRLGDGTTTPSSNPVLVAMP